ncbi:MAG: UDP-N-acetylmuramate dehydrogenase [Lachnospiraceae bacterium]|nr:UDP-N-acetylmuramate dehydrogenase [Lachnospiraceae bacterium]
MYEEFIEELEKAARTKVLNNEMMNRHTTFKVGGPCSLFINTESANIPEVVGICRKNAIPHVILGHGSNVLFGDKGFNGAVIQIDHKKEKVHISADKVTVTADAGALLSFAAYSAYDTGLSGMECLSGIPGSVGGALFMNAGAYGGEMKDVVESALILDKEGNVREVLKDDMDLSYRHSRFMDDGDIILSVKFKLTPGDKDKIKLDMDDYNGRRRDKQPLNYPSAGSFFKRPEGNFAGKLIEDAGLKGASVGDACISEKHAGFLVNKGNATAKDITDLMKKVQDEVYNKFGVRLEPEVKMIGEF